MTKKKSNSFNLLSKRTSFSYLQIALFAIIFGAMGIFAVLQSSAAPRSNPVLTGPVSAKVGDTYVVKGSGFPPNTLVNINRGEAGGCCSAFAAYADEQGNFTVSQPGDPATGSVVSGPGLYTTKASLPQKGNSGNYRTVASWEFTVK